VLLLNKCLLLLLISLSTQSGDFRIHRRISTVDIIMLIHRELKSFGDEVIMAFFRHMYGRAEEDQGNCHSDS
jgi:hypothetical protein